VHRKAVFWGEGKAKHKQESAQKAALVRERKEMQQTLKRKWGGQKRKRGESKDLYRIEKKRTAPRLAGGGGGTGGGNGPYKNLKDDRKITIRTIHKKKGLEAP